MKTFTPIIAISLSAAVVLAAGCDSRQRVIWSQYQGGQRALPARPLPQQQPSALQSQIATLDAQIQLLQGQLIQKRNTRDSLIQEIKTTQDYLHYNSPNLSEKQLQEKSNFLNTKMALLRQVTDDGNKLGSQLQVLQQRRSKLSGQ